MTTSVTIALKAEGVDEVKSAVKSVRQATAEAEEAATAAVAAGSAKRIALWKKEVDEHRDLRGRFVRQEENFSSALGGSRGTRGALVGSSSGEGSLDRVLSSLAGGEGLGGMLKTAGLAAGAIGAMMSGIDMATNALKSFAGFLLSDVVKPAWEVETRAAQVANNSMGQLTAADIEGRARATGIRNNMNPMDIIGAAGDFQNKTGQPKLGFEMLDTIATISKGRGFSVADLTGLAGAMYKPGMQKPELDKLLLGLTAQGAQGSVTIGELARLGGRFTAPASTLAGTYGTRIAEVGALVQSAKPGIGSVDETASAVQAFMREVMRPGARTLSQRSFMREASGTEKLTDVSAYLGDVYRKTSGNTMRLTGAGFTEESQRLIRSYSGTYEKGFGEAKAGGKTDAEAREAGANAVTNFIRSLMTASTTMQAEEANRATVMQTSGQRWETAVEMFKERMLEAMPAVNKFVNELTANGHADELTRAALVIASALVSAADVILRITNGMARVAGWFGAPTEGQVLGTVADRGKDTSFPKEDEAGFWRRTDSGTFEYVHHTQFPNANGLDKGEEAPGPAGAPTRVGPLGTLVYPAAGDTPPVVPPLGSYSAAPPAGSLTSNEADEATSNESDEAAAAAAQAHKDLAQASNDAKDAVSSFADCLDDLCSSMSSPNRSEPFTKR